jgi:hypothetical protein
LFCQKVLRWIVIRESLPPWPADDRPIALADAPPLLKGLKLVSIGPCPPSSLTSPSSRNGLSKTNGRWPQPLYQSRARVCKMLQSYGLQQAVSSHATCGRISTWVTFSCQISCTFCLSRGNLPRSKVVKNIATGMSRQA